MSRLLALPNELISPIIDEIPLTDIESFALCSKATHMLCETAIRRILEERYAIIRLGSREGLPRSYTRIRARDDPAREQHPLLFLDRILSKPNIAQYPTELQIEFNVKDDEDEIEDSEKAALDNAISTWSTRLASFGANNPWLTGELRETWQRALLRPMNRFYHFGMLLTMLPNIQSITISNVLDKAAPMTDMIFAIAEANRDSSSPVHRKALAHIHKVAFETTHSRVSDEEMRMYEPFAALPSIRSLYGNSITGNKREASLSPPHRTTDKSCQFEVVKFVQSAVDADSFHGLLGTAAALKDFTYHHVNYRAGDTEFDALGIVQALAKHASRSLIRLELTAEPSLWHERKDYDPLHRRKCIPSLKDFAKLRVLRFDDKLLQAPHRGSPVRRLVDVLPNSIKIVRLVRETKQDWLEMIFAGLAEEKEKKLPMLKKVIVEGTSFVYRNFVDELEAVGVEMRGAYIL